ncbi:MAG: YitT family protein [Anaeromassilibacillus sp.]
MLNYLFHTPIGTTAFLINIPIFLWAVTEIGYKMVKNLRGDVVILCGN